MTYQDLTAPADQVKVSRREAFSRAYEFFQDETTPQPFPDGCILTAQLTGPNFFLLELTEAAGLDRLNDHTTMVSVTTAQMATMAGGAYQLLLFSEQGTEKDVLVKLQLQVEP